MDDSRASAPPSDAEQDDHRVTEIVSLVVLGLGLLALFLGYSWFWLVFVIGFAVVVPIVELLFGDRNSTKEKTTASNPTATATGTPESKQDALDTLRDRYARGDLSDEEFERKVERLLETETPESAREHVARNDSQRDDSNSRSTEREFE